MVKEDSQNITFHVIQSFVEGGQNDNFKPEIWIQIKGKNWKNLKTDFTNLCIKVNVKKKKTSIVFCQ